jgi:hypothetical protein
MYYGKRKDFSKNVVYCIISYYIYKEAALCLKGKRVYIIYRYLSLYVSQ